MKKLVIVGCVLLMLSACGGGVVTSRGPNHVTIEYDPVLNTIESLEVRADELCGEYNRTAEFISVDSFSAFSKRIANWTCVDVEKSDPFLE